MHPHCSVLVIKLYRTGVLRRIDNSTDGVNAFSINCEHVVHVHSSSEGLSDKIIGN